MCGTEIKRYHTPCFDCSPIAAAALLIVLFLSPLTHLISSSWQRAEPGQFCFILIAYFRLKKLVFLDYFDVEMGAGEQFAFIRQYVFSPALFCANSRIPIYILAVELNYCKHPYGPARHNRLRLCPVLCQCPLLATCRYTLLFIQCTYG